MKTPSLGILEFGYIHPPDLDAYEVINHLFQEVTKLEEMGYTRLWLSEHYSYEFAWLNPEMLLPLLAGYSEKIRVGVAGILLAYHSPLRVAQNFKMLASIYPRRIDLGMARALVPPEVSRYLVRGEHANTAADWEASVNELVAFVREDDPAKGLIENMVVPPHGTALPELWMLGTSGHSMDQAVSEECNYCISFMHPRSDYLKNKDVLKRFRDKFFNRHGRLPTTAVLISCCWNDGSEESEILNRRYLTICDANLFDHEHAIAEKLYRLSKTLENDEFILFNPLVDRNRRIEGYQRISELFIPGKIPA